MGRHCEWGALEKGPRGSTEDWAGQCKLGASIITEVAVAQMVLLAGVTLALHMEK